MAWNRNFTDGTGINSNTPYVSGNVLDPNDLNKLVQNTLYLFDNIGSGGVSVPTIESVFEGGSVNLRELNGNDYQRVIVNFNVVCAADSLVITAPDVDIVAIDCDGYELTESDYNFSKYTSEFTLYSSILAWFDSGFNSAIIDLEWISNANSSKILKVHIYSRGRVLR